MAGVLRVVEDGDAVGLAVDPAREVAPLGRLAPDGLLARAAAGVGERRLIGNGLRHAHRGEASLLRVAEGDGAGGGGGGGDDVHSARAVIEGKEVNGAL